VEEEAAALTGFRSKEDHLNQSEAVRSSQTRASGMGEVKWSGVEVVLIPHEPFFFFFFFWRILFPILISLFPFRPIFSVQEKTEKRKKSLVEVTCKLQEASRGRKVAFIAFSLHCRC
jgi:hypothetical protein